MQILAWPVIPLSFAGNPKKLMKEAYRLSKKKAGLNGSAFSIHASCEICYVSKILTVGSEPVISFFKKGKSFFGDLPFFALL
jgi:hypothetical protein